MKVNLPMLVLIDNIGAIKMLDLKTNKCRTKHVDMRYHWIREFIKDDFVNVKYVKSENNVSDICTKNLPTKLFEKHSGKLVSDVVSFTRCNTRIFPRKKISHWRSRRNRAVRKRMPLGEVYEVSTHTIRWKG